jgi:hypothetical protein
VDEPVTNRLGASPGIQNPIQGFFEMAKPIAETVKAGADALSESAAGSTAAFQELTKAYQELASRNAKNLASAIQAISSVKSPTEFIEVQQKLIKDGVQAAVSDSQNIATLTAAVFSAAFEPVKQQIEAVQKSVLT